MASDVTATVTGFGASTPKCLTINSLTASKLFIRLQRVKKCYNDISGI